MKKTIFIIFSVLTVACYTKYPTTSFWISNNGEKTINFRATVEKQTSFGPQTMSLPFTLRPGDSVLFRKVGYYIHGNPAEVFTEMFFFPLDSRINNPGDSLNWVKSAGPDGKPKYIFYIYPEKK